METYANMMIPWVFNQNKKSDASPYGPPCPVHYNSHTVQLERALLEKFNRT